MVTSPPVTAAATDERTRLDAVGDDIVLGAAQAPSALDHDRVRVRPLYLGTHLLQECDQVVDLWFSRGGPDGGLALGESRSQ
jgi:hypothetical protein